MFTRATQQEYPLSETKRNELQQKQQNLGLNHKDIATIEARINAEIEAYQQKLRQYEQVLTQAIQHEYPLSEETRTELKRFQSLLELGDEEVARIQEKVVRERQTKQNQANRDLPLHTDPQPIQMPEAQTFPHVPSIPVPQQIPWKVGSGLAVAAIATGILIKLLPSEPLKETSGTATDTTVVSSPHLDLGGNVTLTGAGASFPAPLYLSWFDALNKKYPSLQVNYQSVGSGAGIEQFIKGTVDFGASDVAMKDEEIKKIPADEGVLLLPMTAGSIVLAYNLPDVPELKLTRAVYIDILLGKIKSWDDPAIAKANPGAKLPKQPITVVYRSDGSVTTGVFTKHLSAISPEWKVKVGDGKSVKWPVGVGAKGNEGVTAQIAQTQGSIGYTEYGYAKQTGLKFAALENKSGKIVIADDQSAAKTLEAVTLPADLRAFITDPEGADSYPIVTYTWILAHKKYADAAKAKAIEAMIEYGLTEGQKQAVELGYVPLPANVVSKIVAAADQISADYKISTPLKIANVDQ